VIKPFNPRELILRVKALLRRIDENTMEKQETILKDDPFKVEITARKVYKKDKNIELTPKEYSLLKLFIENPGKAFTRDELLNLIWGWDFYGESKIVDVNIRRLRQKIEEIPSQPVYIETVWGTGYRWRKLSDIDQ
jgi:two-component system alkaline phosphatase synthesis response regulator PhoP